VLRIDKHAQGRWILRRERYRQGRAVEKGTEVWHEWTIWTDFIFYISMVYWYSFTFVLVNVLSLWGTKSVQRVSREEGKLPGRRVSKGQGPFEKWSNWDSPGKRGMVDDPVICPRPKTEWSLILLSAQDNARDGQTWAGRSWVSFPIVTLTNFFKYLNHSSNSRSNF
jgi:hypothetical protein